jgi:tight adherence protein B
MVINPLPLAIALSAAFAVWLVMRGRNEETHREAKEHRERAVFHRPGDELSLESAQDSGANRRGPSLLRADKKTFDPKSLIAPAVAGVVGYGAVTMFFGATFAPIGGLAGTVLPIFVQKQKAGSKRKKFNSQLAELLETVAGALQSGQTFLQALSAASNELGDPIATEISMMMREMELGVPVEDVFESSRARVDDPDYDLVVDAVLISRRAGGNLSEVLQNTANTIRERIRIRGEVGALTAQARMSGWILTLLPVIAAGVLYMINPEYMAPFWERSIGRMLLFGSVVSLFIGSFLMRKVADVRL